MHVFDEDGVEACIFQGFSLGGDDFEQLGDGFFGSWGPGEGGDVDHADEGLVEDHGSGRSKARTARDGYLDLRENSLACWGQHAPPPFCQ